MNASTLRTCIFVIGWFVLLGVWTYLLLLPSTKEIGDLMNIPLTRRFLAAKALHFGVYLLLAYLAAYLPRRTACWAILAVHAVLSEVGQYYLPGRSGTVLDVIINLSGMLTGLLGGAWASSSPTRPGSSAAQPASPPG
jgi:VanZ family protein